MDLERVLGPDPRKYKLIDQMMDTSLDLMSMFDKKLCSVPSTTQNMETVKAKLDKIEKGQPKTKKVALPTPGAYSKTVKAKGKVKSLSSKKKMTGDATLPIRSTRANLNPTVNKRNLKKVEDNKRRQQATEEEEKERREKLERRQKLMPHMSRTEVERGFAELDKKLHFSEQIPAHLISKALNVEQRALYDSGEKTLNFYVTKIEQVNSSIDRKFQAGMKRPQVTGTALLSRPTPKKSPEPKKEENDSVQAEGYVAMDEEKPDGGYDSDSKREQRRRKKWIQKQKRKARLGEDDMDDSSEESDSNSDHSSDELGSGVVLSRVALNKTSRSSSSSTFSSSSASSKSSNSSSASSDSSLEFLWNKDDHKKKKAWDDEYTEYRIAKPVFSSKPWYNLKQDKATVEATLRLRGVMEQWIEVKSTDALPLRKKETVEAMLYVHNFRSRMYVNIPESTYSAMGLVPRFDGEEGIYDQFVTIDPPLNKRSGQVLSPEQDAQTTGILSGSSRVQMRQFLNQYKHALETAVAESESAKRKFKNGKHAPYILSMRMVWRVSQEFFQNNCLYPFIEFTTCLPDVVPMARACIEKGIELPLPVASQFAWRPEASEPFECDILYEARFMQDTEIAGETWITLPAHTFSIRPMEDRRTLGTRVDPMTDETVPSVAEFDTSFDTIQVHSQRPKEKDPKKRIRPLPFNLDEIMERSRNKSWKGSKGFRVDETRYEPLSKRVKTAAPPLVPAIQPTPLLPSIPSKPPEKGPERSIEETKILMKNAIETTQIRIEQDMAKMGADLCLSKPKEPEPVPKPEEVKKEALKKEVDEKKTGVQEEDWSRIPDYRLTAYDIECYAKKGFPNALIDPVVAESFIFDSMNNIGRLVPDKAAAADSDAIVVCTRPSRKFADLPNAVIVTVESEHHMFLFKAFLFYMTCPTILLSFNGNRFDLPYDLDRAQTLGIDLAQYWSVVAEPLTIREHAKETVGTGAVIHMQIHLAGINCLDEYIIVRKIEQDKLTSYTLNNVSWHYLQQRKSDVHHTDIPNLYLGTLDQVQRLLRYNIIDSWLVVKLFSKRKHNLNIPIMARITGIQAQQLFDWGPSKQSQISFMLECQPWGLLKPYRRRKDDQDKFAGATVITPKTGFVPDPVIVEDFASLYPSIMIAFNLCITTYLTLEIIEKYQIPKDQYIQVPSGRGGRMTYWAKRSLRVGIIPTQVQSFLDARADFKVKMKKAKDANEKDVYDGSQAETKRKANSIYGLTKQILEEIASTVTFFGRMMIGRCKELVETWYTPANGFGPAQGFPQLPVVRYGDTDSIMCHFGPIPLVRAFALGKEISEACCLVFANLKPIKLEFEKVYYPYLIPKKKRYAGVYWTEDIFNKTGTYQKVDKKGSEAVRSDSCIFQKETMQDIYDILLLGHLSKTSTAPEVLQTIFREERHLRKWNLSKRLKREGYQDASDPKGLHPDLIDFSRDEYVDPYTYWSDPESKDYTAPLPAANPLWEELPPKELAEFKRTIPDRKALVKSITPQIFQNRVRIAFRLICFRTERLLNGKVDLSKLILSKSLRKKNYPSLVVQVYVANLIRGRDPGSAPTTGDRVHYVYRRMPKGSKMAHCADEPMHVLKQREPIDFGMYERKSMRRPLSGMMIPVLKTLYPERPEFQCGIYYDSEAEDETVDASHGDNGFGLLEEDDMELEVQNPAIAHRLAQNVRHVSLRKACPIIPDYLPPALVAWFKNPIGLCFVWHAKIKEWLPKDWGQSLGLVADAKQLEIPESQLDFLNYMYCEDSLVKAQLKKSAPGFATFARLIVTDSNPTNWNLFPDKWTLDPEERKWCTIVECLKPWKMTRRVETLKVHYTQRDGTFTNWLVKWSLYNQLLSPFLFDCLRLFVAKKFHVEDKLISHVSIETALSDVYEMGQISLHDEEWVGPKSNGADREDELDFQDHLKGLQEDGLLPSSELKAKTASTPHVVEEADWARLFHAGKWWKNLTFNYGTKSNGGNQFQFNIEYQKPMEGYLTSKTRKNKLIGHSEASMGSYTRSIDSFFRTKDGRAPTETKVAHTRDQRTGEGKKYKIEPFNPDGLQAKKSKLDPSADEVKYIKRILAKRTKTAIESAEKLIFEGLERPQIQAGTLFDSKLVKGWKGTALVRQVCCIQCKSVITTQNSFLGTAEDVLCVTCSCACGAYSKSVAAREEYDVKYTDWQRQQLTRVRHGKETSKKASKSITSFFTPDCPLGVRPELVKCDCRRKDYLGYHTECLQDIEDTHTTIWNGCDKCASSRVDAERCKNSDCTFFFKRQALGMELEQARKKLALFGI